MECEHSGRVLSFSWPDDVNVGPGAIISEADNGNFRLLLSATVVMAMIVVSINRLVWRRLYALTATRFKLEA